jgi:hypothetical protein
MNSMGYSRTESFVVSLYNDVTGGGSVETGIQGYLRSDSDPGFNEDIDSDGSWYHVSISGGSNMCSGRGNFGTYWVAMTRA